MGGEGQRTYHMEIISSNELMTFPSITVCTNVVLKKDFNFSLISGFNDSIHQMLIGKCPKASLMKKWKNVIENNQMAVLRYLRTINDERRKNLSISLSEFVTTCELGKRTCNFSDPKSVHVFNHPFFGNCFTFNPAFDKQSTKLTKFHEKLDLNLRLHPNGYKLMPYHKAMVTVRIHAPGTAPLMQPPESQIVFGGQRAIMALELSETTVFKKWSKSMPSCVDINDVSYRKRSRYYHENSPYKYSLEACMKSCEQDYIGKKCNMVNPFLALQPEEYEHDKNASFVRDCALEQPLTMETCNCPRPCEKTDYHIIRQDADLNNIPCQEKEMVTTCQNSTEQDIENGNQDEAIIDIFYRTHVYVKLEEHLSYSLSDYLGILGGNMSLWIGLCVVSLLEVVELVVNVVLGAIQMRQQKKHKIQSDIATTPKGILPGQHATSRLRLDCHPPLQTPPA